MPDRSAFSLKKGIIGRLSVAPLLGTGFLSIGGTLTADRTATFPDATMIVAGSAAALTSTQVIVGQSGGLLGGSSDLTFDGVNLVLGGSAAAARRLRISAGAGNLRLLAYQTAGSDRWALYATVAPESGANAGSDINLDAYSDAGANIGSVLSITRAAGGPIAFARPVTCSSTLGVTGVLSLSAGISLSTIATITSNALPLSFIRPGGYAVLVLTDTAGANYSRWSCSVTQAHIWSNSTGGTVFASILTTGELGIGAAAAAGAGLLQLASGTTIANGILLGDVGIFRNAANAVTINATAGVMATGPLSATTLTATGLTSGRLPFVSTGGLLTDSGTLRFGTGVLTTGNSATSGYLTADTPVSSACGLVLQAAGLTRWVWLKDGTVEAGANAGSSLLLYAYNDAGTVIDTPISIVRAGAGTITLSRPVSCGSTLTTAGGRLVKTRSVVSAAATTALDSTDHAAILTGTTTQTFTLPAAAAGRQLYIKNRSTAALTVNRAGADTIDGGTTLNVAAGSGVLLVANGTDWVVL